MRKIIILLLILLTLPCVLAEEAPIVRNGDRSVPKVAITVDDCYNGEHVLSVVELCEKHGMAVTFFPIGKALKYADADIWQRALDAGCEIGNHSWGHTNLTRLTDQKIRFQMLRTQQKLDQMLGYHYPMQVMRPMGGYANSRVGEAVASVGYRYIVKWDVSQTEANKALREVQNGSILLFHANVRDIRCLETLIPALQEQGYACVTVSELLGLPPVKTSPEIYFYDPADAVLP